MTEKNKNQAENKKHSATKSNPADAKTEANAVTEAKAVQPNDQATNTPTLPATSMPATPTKSKSGFGLSLVAITMVVALGASVYHFGMIEKTDLNGKIDLLTSQVDTLKSDLQQTNAAHAASLAQAKQEKATLEILMKQQDNSLASLQSAVLEMQGRRPNDWLLAEANYLVQLAGRQLWIQKDIPTSISLLETADERIAQLNDPSLTPVRQAMSNDLQTLKSIERIDTDGIVLRLSSLQNQVDSLVLANALLSEEEQQLTPKVVSDEISNWKENLVTSMQDFAAQFITYRKREGNVVPLLTPAQTFYLQENIKAKLAQAITAVYRENPELYTASLQTAKQWILDFYHLELPETQAFIQTIDQLEQQTIKVVYPTELTSLDLISNELSQRLSKELANLISKEVNNG